MLGGVGAVLELLQDDASGDAVAQGLGSLDGTRHTVLAAGQTNLCTVGLHQVATLHTHRLRHRQDQFVALHGTDECETYARVTACRLDNRGTGLQQPFLLGVFNHRQGDTVLDTATGVKEFHFGDNRGLQTLSL